MKNHFPIFLLILITSSCNFISKHETCAEFRLKNGLSSTVILRSIQIIDSSTIFYLDSFSIAPNETQIIHKDCSLSDVNPYPTGNFAKFTFSNNKSKIDTLRNLSYSDFVDTISIYNKKRWTSDYSQSHLKIATYTISAKDSLEAN